MARLGQGREFEAAFLSFLMAGFSDQPEYFLDDGLHPNQAAQPLIADNITAVDPGRADG